jgi:hypothetical protein
MGAGLLGQVTVEGEAGIIFYALLRLRERDVYCAGDNAQPRQ